MWQKYFLQISTWSLILLGFILLLGPKEWFPDFYHPFYFGIIALLSPVLVYLPLLLKAPTAAQKKRVLDLQVIIAFSLLINIGGELGLYQLYKYGFEYDKFAHFLVCMMLAFIFAEVLKEWTALPLFKIVLLVLTASFLSGILWEVIEAASDLFFGTHEWGVYGMNIAEDTSKDMIFNMLGGLSGIFVSLISKR